MTWKQSYDLLCPFKRTDCDHEMVTLETLRPSNCVIVSNKLELKLIERYQTHALEIK